MLPGHGRLPCVTVSSGHPLVVREDRAAHTHVCLVSEEEAIYLCAQNGASLGDVIQQRQRRQWGIDFIPSFHPSSSALAPMMEQSLLSPSPALFSVPSLACYPTPESLFCDDSLSHNYLPDVLPDGGSKSVSDPKCGLSSPNLMTLSRMRNILVSIQSADKHGWLIRSRLRHRFTTRSRQLPSSDEGDIYTKNDGIGWPSKSQSNRTNPLRY